MVLTSLDAFSSGAEWPISSEAERIGRYEKNGLLYDGRHMVVWPDLNPFPGKLDAFDLMGNADRNHVDMTVNWYKRSTTCFADLICGEPFKAAANPQATADRIIKDNSLILKTYDVCMDMIRNGTGIFKARFDKRGIVDVINPRLWYPIVSPDNKEFTAHVLAWSFKSGESEYVRAEIHERGKIRNKLFLVEGGKLRDIPLTTFERYAAVPPETDTGVPEFLVVPVQNILGSDGVFGMDDYSDMNDLVKELEKRLIQASRVFTKHADPSITGPRSTIDIDPYSGEAVVQGGGLYFGYNTGEPQPAYMVWDARLGDAFTQITEIKQALYMVSELSPAALGELKQGLAESGSALKRLMMPTLAKVNRLRLRLDPGVREILRVVSLLEVVGRGSGATPLTNITITFEDGLPRDEVEIVKNEVSRKNAGLTTIADSLRRLDPWMSESNISDAVSTIKEENPNML
ncbi:portal protein [Candidatus Pacearchaeota archaeon]|nr:portal protein [Candidatus Pacearchaeota archaeon]